ncbi:MAG: flagellar hook-basal body protein [Bacillota bacterium]|nr:flagellar hook-basal body protein [Bacillota bacterium]
MIRGLYTAASGMLVGMARQDVWSNNLANAQTPGYRQDEVALRSFPDVLLKRYEAASPAGVILGRLGSGADVAEVVACSLPGRYVQTQNPLDLALEGDGYLAVATAAGTRYTRQGRLHLDGDGFLCTATAHRVLDQSGVPIRLAGGEEPVIEPDGRLIVAGESAGQIGLWRIAGGVSPRKEGQNLFAAGAVVPDGGMTRVRQSSVELPNLDAIGAMTEMLSILRAYEASQKALQAQDETLGKAVNEVGRV